MGCWGTGTFENASAQAWAGALEERHGLDAVSQVLCAPRNGEFISADEAAASLAAAEVVAALLGHPSGELPVRVARWVSENRGLDARPYRDMAMNHARAILAGHCELRDRWAADESGYPFWKATVEALIARLESADHGARETV